MTRFGSSERHNNRFGPYVVSIYHSQSLSGEEYFRCEVFDGLNRIDFKVEFRIKKTQVRLSVMLENFKVLISWMEEHHIFLQEDDGEHYLNYLMNKFFC